jgi:homoserine O-succinyltransferase
MPDAALESTERQFVDLLNAAAGSIPVRVSFFSIPEVARSEATKGQMGSRYRTIDELWTARIDGLIVTGTEPRAAVLEDEPYWQSLTHILEWGQANTTSSVWSCLAAHAAVLHLDGISRRSLGVKRFGVFDCTAVAEHPFLAGLATPIRVAHSRWNELDEQALTSSGYTILTRSAEAGVDAFVKKRKNSQFLFFQGHPEYDARALLREYRRDVGRFLRGERKDYPPPPHGYFNAAGTQLAAAFQERALAERKPAIFDDFPMGSLEHCVCPIAPPSSVRVYRNWLALLAAQKAQREHPIVYGGPSLSREAPSPARRSLAKTAPVRT